MNPSAAKRITASFIIFFFAFTNLVPSGLSQAINGTPLSSEKIPLSHLELNLPEELGKVEEDRKSTRLNSSHSAKSRMPSSA